MTDKARETVDKFQLYKGGSRPGYIMDMDKDIQFVNNAQWDVEVSSALEAANQPVVVNNEMKPARDQVVNQITDNNPRWIALPREGSDSKIAGQFSALGSYIWDASTGAMHFYKAVEDFTDTGMFVMHTYVDPNGDDGKGEIYICRYKPRDVYLDPQSSWRNAQDSKNIFLSNILSEGAIKTLYPDFSFKDATTVSPTSLMNVSMANNDGQVFSPDFLADENYYEVIDRYEKIQVSRFRVFDPYSNFEKILDKDAYIAFAKNPAVILVKMGSEKVVTDQVEVEKILRMVDTYGKVFHYMGDGSIRSGTDNHPAELDQQGQLIYPIPNSTVEVKIGTMADLLQEGRIKWKKVLVPRIKRTIVIGEKWYTDYVMPISKYPFGITMLHHTDTPFPYGDARLTKSIQEQINKTHSLIIAYHINITNVKVLVPDGTDEKELEKRWGKAGAQFFKYDPELGGAPIVVQLTAMSNELYNHIDRLKHQIQRIYGVYEFQDGNVSIAPQTKGGTYALDEMGYRRSKGKLKLIEMALNDLGSVVSELIPYVYDERKVIRIIGKNNKVKEMIFNEEVEDEGMKKVINDLTINKYDLKVESNSTLPTNLQQRFENKLRLWEMQLIRNPEAILRDSGIEDIESIIDEENRLKQAEEIIGQLQETIKDMDGQLQSQSRELIHADRQVSKAKFNEGLSKISSKMEAWLELSKARLNDTVKEKKQVAKPKK